MNNQTHKIKQLIIEVTSNNQKNASNIQNKVSTIHKENLISIIEKCCSNYSDPHTNHRIEKLELDLGTIKLNELDIQFAGLVELKLQEELSKRSTLYLDPMKPNIEEKQEQKKTPTLLELVTSFLLSGVLPWWAENGSKGELDAAMEKLIDSTPDEVRELIIVTLRNSQYFKRLITQFNDKTLLKIINFITLELKETKEVDEKEIRKFREDGIKTKDDTNEVKKEGEIEAESTTIRKLTKIRELINIKELKDLTPKEHLQLLHSKLKQSDSNQNDNEQKIYPTKFSQSHELYINNSGLVILWPYLPNLFKNLGLVKDKAFTTPEATWRAALLLQYLADNSLEAPEYLLPLNKILCGIDISESDDTTLNITKDEKEECNDLLTAILQNWPILKNTTPLGLQQAFLQREGVIGLLDGGWILRVKREGYDVVMDKLNWSIGVVKLPWMGGVIYVEWVG